MKIKIEENKNKLELTVYVSCPLRSGREPKIQYTTEDVLEEIKSKGYEVESVLKPVIVRNISERYRHGTCVFKLHPPPKPKRKYSKKKKEVKKIINKTSQEKSVEEMTEKEVLDHLSALGQEIENIKSEE